MRHARLGVLARRLARTLGCEAVLVCRAERDRRLQVVYPWGLARVDAKPGTIGGGISSAARSAVSARPSSPSIPGAIASWSKSWAARSHARRSGTGACSGGPRVLLIAAFADTPPEAVCLHDPGALEGLLDAAGRAGLTGCLT
jgi:hypothetical protein